MLKLENSLSRRKEVFRPLKGKTVGLYTCGPTVYQYPQIGNYRTYIFSDILKRVLSVLGYKIRHVLNITDVGHPPSDADKGEEKKKREARKERKSAIEIARLYEKAFKEDL